MKTVIAIPVYNEAKHLAAVLQKILDQGMKSQPNDSVEFLVVDDGSTDATPDVLRNFPNVHVVRHSPNRGYGAALRSAFEYACRGGFEIIVTLDSDGQHEPSLIPDFIQAAKTYDIVSGSRYLKDFAADTPAPMERRRINLLVTDELNACFHLGITDSFCGFKAYRTSALRQLRLTEEGYGMPLEMWVHAACRRLSIHEIAIPRVYLDLNRSFGENLDDANIRLAYYQKVIDRAMVSARHNVDCGMKAARGPLFQKVDP